MTKSLPAGRLRYVGQIMDCCGSLVYIGPSVAEGDPRTSAPPVDEARLNSDVRTYRVCYFLVCYLRVDYVSFLFSSLYNPDDLFIIHCDPKAPARLHSFCSQICGKYQNILALRSQSYSWAGFSHVDISVQAIDLALSPKFRWSHFVFLSEQHLPLKGPDEIAASLPTDRSVFASIRVNDHHPSAQADIFNRFASVFRELPGVGCFATALRDDPQSLMDVAYHGSNWIILSRDHCRVLSESASRGDLDLYRTVVHAEELAIPTILGSHASRIDKVDRTLVAHPHITDNHSLIMTDELFLSALKTDCLFIRKRTERLSDDVERAVRSNHFHDIGILGPSKPAEDIIEDRLRDSYFQTISRCCTEILGPEIRIEMLDAERFAPSPRVHVNVVAKSWPENISLRVLSEDLNTFKVALIEENSGTGRFSATSTSEGLLLSTLRVRVYGLFGNTEILSPMIPDAGFVERVALDQPESLLETIRRQIAVANSLSR